MCCSQFTSTHYSWGELETTNEPHASDMDNNMDIHLFLQTIPTMHFPVLTRS